MSNETLGIKDSVVRIHGSLRLGGIANKALGFVESNVLERSTVIGVSWFLLGGAHVRLPAISDSSVLRLIIHLLVLNKYWL